MLVSLASWLAHVNLYMLLATCAAFRKILTPHVCLWLAIIYPANIHDVSDITSIVGHIYLSFFSLFFKPIFILSLLFSWSMNASTEHVHCGEMSLVENLGRRSIWIGWGLALDRIPVHCLRTASQPASLMLLLSSKTSYLLFKAFMPNQNL